MVGAVRPYGAKREREWDHATDSKLVPVVKEKGYERELAAREIAEQREHHMGFKVENGKLVEAPDEPLPEARELPEGMPLDHLMFEHAGLRVGHLLPRISVAQASALFVEAERRLSVARDHQRIAEEAVTTYKNAVEGAKSLVSIARQQMENAAYRANPKTQDGSKP